MHNRPEVLAKKADFRWIYSGGFQVHGNLDLCEAAKPTAIEAQPDL
jgi:hypothetical protein